jgi:hypothetical protein
VRARGAVNVIGLGLLVIAVGSIYAIVIFSPAVIDNMAVQSAIAGTHAEASRVDDDTLRGRIQEKLRVVGSHEEQNDLGQTETVPGLGIPNELIVIDRDTVQNKVTIHIPYQRRVALRPFGKVITLNFHPLKEGPVGQ